MQFLIKLITIFFLLPTNIFAHNIILLHHAAPLWRGVETHLFAYHKMLVQHGHNSLMITTPNSPMEQALKTAKLPYLAVLENQELKQVCQDYKPDIIVCVRMQDLSVADNAVTGLPTKIIYQHHLHKSLSESDIGVIFAHADGIVSVNKNIIAQLQAVNGRNIPLEYMPSFIDEEKFRVFTTSQSKDDFFKTHFNITLKPLPIICMIANMYDGDSLHKNHPIMLRAVQKLVQKKKPVELLLVGDGSKRNYLEQLAGTLGISDYVHFLGFCQETPGILYHSDIHVLSSSAEAFGLAHLEAGFMRKPTIGARETGAREIIQDGITGLLFNGRCVKDLASKIEKLIDNPVLCKSMGTNAYKHIQENFSNHVIYDQHEQFLSALHHTPRKQYDVTLVGYVNHADGLGRIPIALVESLKDILTINFISTHDGGDLRGGGLSDTSSSVKKIFFNPDHRAGNVALLQDLIWFKDHDNYKKVPPSTIKLAYTMLESSAIPPQWVEALNNHFDAVVVPDQNLVEIYKNSGVTLPIFVIPIGLYLEELLEKPLKQEPRNPFVFGTAVAFEDRKNHLLLIKAFAQEFKDRTDVMLRINGRIHDKSYLDEVTQLIKDLAVPNIQITSNTLPWPDYIRFLSRLDCYINIPKGEGFSITPREVLALGIPCILTDNTAQKTICASGHVRAVPCTEPMPAYYKPYLFGPEPIGVQYNCTQQAVQEALRDVYTNYQTYLARAHKGRAWTKQYLWQSLQKKYLNLFKPQHVILGDENSITDEYLMTNSKALYEKYKLLASGKGI